MLSSSGEQSNVPQSWKNPPTRKDCRQEGVLDDFRGYKKKPVFAYAGSWKVTVVVLSFYESDPVISSSLEPSLSFFFHL